MALDESLDESTRIPAIYDRGTRRVSTLQNLRRKVVQLERSRYRTPRQNRELFTRYARRVARHLEDYIADHRGAIVQLGVSVPATAVSMYVLSKPEVASGPLLARLGMYSMLRFMSDSCIALMKFSHGGTSYLQHPTGDQYPPLRLLDPMQYTPIEVHFVRGFRGVGRNIMAAVERRVQRYFSTGE